MSAPTGSGFDESGERAEPANACTSFGFGAYLGIPTHFRSTQLIVIKPTTMMLVPPLAATANTTSVFTPSTPDLIGMAPPPWAARCRSVLRAGRRADQQENLLQAPGQR